MATQTSKTYRAEPLIGDTPWMTKTCIHALGRLLQDSRCFLEYGAGGSTRFAAAHEVKSLISVESDIRFLNVVDGYIQRDSPNLDWHPIHVDIGRVGPLGYPLQLKSIRRWLRYPSRPWVAGHQPDLVLIDGRFRLACALATAYYAQPGTTVFFDDYLYRPWYWTAERFLSMVAKPGRARIFKVPDTHRPHLRAALVSACRDPR